MMRVPRNRIILALACMTAGFAVYDVTTARAGADETVAAIAAFDPGSGRADYVEQCGGCHGVSGRSAPAQLPELRDRVGYFMCTPDSRAYLLRLPNVAHSRITDNQQLADLMNFVVFGLGGASAPKQALPFTGDEVARERKNASSAVSLKAERARYVEQAIRKCRAPASLRAFFPGTATSIAR
jgi:hypothetical protein